MCIGPQYRHTQRQLHTIWYAYTQSVRESHQDSPPRTSGACCCRAALPWHSLCRGTVAEIWVQNGRNMQQKWPAVDGQIAGQIWDRPVQGAHTCQTRGSGCCIFFHDILTPRHFITISETCLNSRQLVSSTLQIPFARHHVGTFSYVKRFSTSLPYPTCFQQQKQT